MTTTNNRLKWIEDKSQDFRRNWEQWAFKLDNSDYIFEFNSYMTYKSFKSAVRKLAQLYGAKVIMVCEPFRGTQQEHVNNPAWLLVGKLGEGKYWFYKELVVKNGKRRQQKEYSESEVFKK